MFAPMGDSDLPRRSLIIISYLILLSFVAFNLRRPGIAILAVGLVLNFLPIIANGGLMPVTPATLEAAGYHLDVAPGEWVPRSKDVLLEREKTRLWFLTDRFVWRDLPTARAFSPGDVLIAAGLLLTLCDLFLPRWRRVPAAAARKPVRPPDASEPAR